MQISFESLRLSNYRYYYGEQELIFSTDPKKNVIIIKGDNGAGKSNLLNALTWCLYDEEIHIDKKSDNLPIMNTQYIAELANSKKEGETWVQLTLNVEGTLWEITRTIHGYGEQSSRDKDKPAYNFHESFRGLQVRYLLGDDYKIETGDAAQTMIWELLPPDLRSFFFIDGEQLHEFFKKDASHKMRDSIEKLSQLELIESAIISLEQYRSFIRKKISESSPKAEQDIQNKLDELEQKKSQFQKDKTTLIQKKENMISDINDIEQFLKNYNINEIKLLNLQIMDTDKKIIDEKKKSEDYLKKKNNLLINSAPIIYMKDTLWEAYNVIDKLIERGTLPPMIRESFIRQLLNKGTCLCGMKITPEIKETLETYAEKIQISEMDGIAHEGKLELEKCFETIKAFPEELASINDKIDDSERTIVNLKNQKQSLEDKREGLNIDEINEKAKKRDELLRKVGEFDSKIRIVEIKINECKLKIQQLYIIEEREKAKNSAHSEYSEKLNLVNNVIEAVQQPPTIFFNQGISLTLFFSFCCAFINLFLKNTSY